MKTTTVFLIVLLVVGAVVPVWSCPYRSYSYQLDLGVPGGNGGLVGTGAWAEGPTTFSWLVTQETPDSPWHYRYILNLPSMDVSHLILETSENFEPSNMWNVSFPGSTLEFDDDFGTGGNPNIPGGIGGVKFDSTQGVDNVVFEFDSDRAPVWGDVYAKGGGRIKNSLWNEGFNPNELPGSAADPQFAVFDGGSLDGHILVPDSYFSPPPPPPPPSDVPIPEPLTAVGLLVSIGFLGSHIRRRRN